LHIGKYHLAYCYPEAKWTQEILVQIFEIYLMRQYLEVARVKDPDVGGNLVAGVDEHDIAEAELLGVKGHLLSVPWKKKYNKR
jgi:hypothetical protein